MSADIQIQIRAEVDRDDIQVCRFTVDRLVSPGHAAFATPQEAKDNGLADRLFKLAGVSKVEVDGNLVAVTQSGTEDWRQLGKGIGSAVRNFLNTPPQILEGDRLPPKEGRRRGLERLERQRSPGVGMRGG